MWKKARINWLSWVFHVLCLIGYFDQNFYSNSMSFFPHFSFHYPSPTLFQSSYVLFCYSSPPPWGGGRGHLANVQQKKFLAESSLLSSRDAQELLNAIVYIRILLGGFKISVAPTPPFFAPRNSLSSLLITALIYSTCVSRQWLTESQQLNRLDVKKCLSAFLFPPEYWRNN